MTLSPFFGQFRGFLKVYQKPASRDHFIHFEGLTGLASATISEYLFYAYWKAF